MCLHCENGVITDYCRICNGTGEDLAPNTTCPVCKGKGEFSEICDCELGKEYEQSLEP